MDFEIKSVLVDKVRLKIIFNNMVSNAIKFIGKGKDHHYLYIKTTYQAGFATLRFKDNGIGISRAYREKVYDMFFRASDNTEGTGLGLYITKECVEKLNGEIALDSEESLGTTFTIQIPVKLS